MKNKSSLLAVMSTGFALFSMFFGSGNLVFPLQLGCQHPERMMSATAGLLLTGILLPSLGIVAIRLYNGCYRQFFDRMGCRAGSWFPLLALSLMGPFGVLPRCLTVAQASFTNIVPDTSASGFILLSCVVIYVLNQGQRRTLTLLGSVLSPLLLLALGCIVLQGYYFADPLANTPVVARTSPFLDGLAEGYQTMDLLAAFFFSAFVLRGIKDQESMRPFGYSCALGMALLGTIYVALVGLGGIYHEKLLSLPPELLLAEVAIQSLGSWGAVLVCLCVTLSCLTTGVVLAKLFADYLNDQFGPRWACPRMSMAVTLLISFGVSTLEFSGIAAIIGPILECLYPALFVVTLQLILERLGYARPRPYLLPLAMLISFCWIAGAP